MIYLGIANLLLLLGYALRGMRRLREVLYPTVLFALFVFVAFRFEVGCDWSGYLNQFMVARGLSVEEALSGRDPLWWLLIMGQHRLGLPYPWLNVAAAVIFFAGVHALARRQPDPLAFLVLLFPILIVNMPMSGIRQGAAIGVVCFAFTQFLDRRPLRFVLWTLIAAALHSSALIFLLLSPLGGGQFSWKRIYLAAILAIPGTILLLSTTPAEVAFSRYVIAERDSAGAIYRGSMVFLSGIYFFFFIRKYWRQAFPGDYAFAFTGALTMLPILLLLPLSTVIADRLAYFLLPFQAAIFSRVPFLPISRDQKLLAAIPYLGIAFVFSVWTQQSWHFQRCYLPYGSWLFGFPATL